jgi:hypothetical protein
VRLSFLPQLRDKRLRDCIFDNSASNAASGAFPLTAHRGSLSQLIGPLTLNHGGLPLASTIRMRHSQATPTTRWD